MSSGGTDRPHCHATTVTFTGNFARGDESFGDAKTYAEWKFTHSPMELAAPQPAGTKP